ncbi:hypothetical protein MO973_16235 [Paenibacillus sp. TRM 82003]|nr:hypothetical protein [Paenibacillus sp. TRM 82003]
MAVLTATGVIRHPWSTPHVAPADRDRHGSTTPTLAPATGGPTPRRHRPTPRGHTPGTTCYLWDSVVHRSLLTGDFVRTEDAECKEVVLDPRSRR